MDKRIITGFAVLLFALWVLLQAVPKAIYYHSSDVLADVQVKITEMEPRRSSKSNSYDVYVDYKYDGKTYEHVKLDYYYSGLRVGDTIDVRINPYKPGTVITSQTPQMLIGAFLAFLGGRNLWNARKQTADFTE